MITPAPARELKSGEYTILRNDNESDRQDARGVMKRQGCKSIRFAPQADRKLVCHGYLALMYGADFEAL